MKRFSRRRLLTGALLGSVGGGLFAAVAPRVGRARGSRLHRCHGTTGRAARVLQPAGRFAPETEQQLIDFLGRVSGPLRPVGAGHSFSGLVPTDGHLVVLDRLTGLRSHDPATFEATLGAGMRLAETGPALEEIGQAMLNLPDIDRQTLAGAISTGTHGTGLR